ncbi:MAG TPA: hypothetical protein VFZ08_12410 [Terriglobia bacterium]|nr:hypothetical protein [Terriglobia bacterium]
MAKKNKEPKPARTGTKAAYGAPLKGLTAEDYKFLKTADRVINEHAELFCLLADA